MRFVRFIFWLWLPLLFVGCAYPNGTSGAMQNSSPSKLYPAQTALIGGYFIETPAPFYLQGVQFEPEEISGDGKVVLGCCEWPSGMETTWSASAGFRATTALPARYSVLVKALNHDGSVATGIFIRRPFASPGITDYGLFRWRLSSPAELLVPHISPPNTDGGLFGPAEISDDGARIWFFCNNVNATRQCPVIAAQPKPWVAEVWSQDTGFTLANAGLPNRFTYVTPLGAGKTFLAGVLGTGPFGLVNSAGRFSLLAGFPADFDPQKDTLITNSTVTVIALPRKFGYYHGWLWNAQGAPLPLPYGLAQCPHFPLQILNIDDGGAIFGSQSCPSLAGSSVDIGVRVSAKGPQLLGDWLRSRGVANDLPPSTQTRLVSDDGRTIYGQTAFPPAIGGATSTRSLQTNCSDSGCLFLAHIP